MPHRVHICMLLQSSLRHTACMLCLSALSAADSVIMHAYGFLQDLDPLSTLPKLQHLSLLDNPVTKQPNYRCVSTKCMSGQCCISKPCIISKKDLIAVRSWRTEVHTIVTRNRVVGSAQEVCALLFLMSRL